MVMDRILAPQPREMRPPGILPVKPRIADIDVGCVVHGAKPARGARQVKRFRRNGSPIWRVDRRKGGRKPSPRRPLGRRFTDGP